MSATEPVLNHPYYIILNDITLHLLHYITGPVHNIMVNGKEVMRALVCATELTINHPYYIILYGITLHYIYYIT